MDRKQLKYFLSAIASYIIWGFIPVLIREIQEHNPFEIVYFRMLFSFLVILIYVLLIQKKFFDECKQIWRSKRRTITIILTAIGGLLLALNWFLYVYVVNKVSINAAAFAYFILPIITAALAYFILKERLDTFKILGIIVSTISCILLANIGWSDFFYVIFISLTYSLYLISQRKNTEVSRASNLTLQLSVGVLFFSLVIPQNLQILFHWNYFLWIITCIAICFTVTPLLLNLYALNGLESGQLAFMIYINPTISFVIGIIKYNESLNFLTLLAYILLPIAILFFNWTLLKKVLNKIKR